MPSTGEADRILTFTPDGGTTYRLTDWDNGVHALTGNVAGHILPPYEVISDVVPGLDGARFRAIRATSRVISIPMWIEGPDRPSYRSRVRDLIRAVAPDEGRFGWLEFTEMDGSRRRIRCIYQNGLQGVEDVSNGGRVWWRFVLEFTALDPWWYGDTVTQEIAYVGPVPFFPTLRLSTSQVLGSITLFNEGEISVYPRIVIDGPGTNIQVTYPNGDVLAFTGAVPVDSQLVIVSAPGQQSITLDGASWWDHLTEQAALSPVPPGESVMTVQMTGADANSHITVEHEPRYRSPL